MTDKEPDDFERARDAFRAGAEVSDEALTSYEAAAGLLAALREMREPGENQLAEVEPALDRIYDPGNKGDPGYEAGGKAVYQAMLDELIRQGEASLSQDHALGRDSL